MCEHFAVASILDLKEPTKVATDEQYITSTPGDNKVCEDKVLSVIPLEDFRTVVNPRFELFCREKAPRYQPKRLSVPPKHRIFPVFQRRKQPPSDGLCWKTRIRLNRGPKSHRCFEILVRIQPVFANHCRAAIRSSTVGTVRAAGSEKRPS